MLPVRLQPETIVVCKLAYVRSICLQGRLESEDRSRRRGSEDGPLGPPLPFPTLLQSVRPVSHASYETTSDRLLGTVAGALVVRSARRRGDIAPRGIGRNNVSSLIGPGLFTNPTSIPPDAGLRDKRNGAGVKTGKSNHRLNKNVTR